MIWKKGMIVVSLLFLPAFLFSQEEESPAGLQVTRAAICKEVIQREPIDSDTVFPSDIGKVFCFSKIEGARSPVAIFHIWKYKDKEMARVKLNVKSSSWRTWSSKKILASWVGPWMVEIQDESGTILKTLEFEIK